MLFYIDPCKEDQVFYKKKATCLDLPDDMKIYKDVMFNTFARPGGIYNCTQMTIDGFEVTACTVEIGHCPKGTFLHVGGECFEAFGDTYNKIGCPI